MNYCSSSILSIIIALLSSIWVPCSAFGLLQTSSAQKYSPLAMGGRSSRPHSETRLCAKKILLAFDGTSENARDFAPDKETDRSFSNVLKLHLLAGGDINGRINSVPGQICLYERGIGGITTNMFLAIARQFFGDLTRQTRPARKRLEEVYEKGDKLYIIGHSRGSASARKFAIELHEKGLRTKDGEKVDSPAIEFLGCFDTVSQQVSRNLFAILRTGKKMEITKSTVLGENGQVAPNVKKAVHNLSLDDNRSFGTLGLGARPPVHMGSTDERVHETWFAGAHGDVGGGYYTKGIPDFSCKYMQEWMEGIEDGLTFINPEDINPASLVIDDFPDIKINAADISIIPNATDVTHLTERQMKKPSYRPVIVVSDDKIVPGATVKVHESVLHHMEALEEKGEPTPFNVNLKTTSAVIVGPLDKVLEPETKRFAKLVEMK